LGGETKGDGEGGPYVGEGGTKGRSKQAVKRKRKTSQKKKRGSTRKKDKESKKKKNSG